MRVTLPKWQTKCQVVHLYIRSFLPHFFFFCGTGVWTQDLHLEPLHQPYFHEVLFWDRVSQTICQGWHQTEILLISASWVTRITGMSHLKIEWARNSNKTHMFLYKRKKKSYNQVILLLRHFHILQMYNFIVLWYNIIKKPDIWFVTM
jgi:hypothetical protein